MNKEDQIKLLMRRIKTLSQELKDNPQYPDSWVLSITEDIEYYQNQIDFLCNS